MNKIIVTGGLGFIGFNFIKYLVEEIRIMPTNIISVDCITYAAQYKLEKKLEYLQSYNIKNYAYDFTKSDEVKKIDELIQEEKVDTIVHFGAESHVDNSINNPNVFLETNIIGTNNLLNLARKYNLRIHVIGTDEVYGDVDPEKDYVDEKFTIKPSSPYSVSKTASDLLALAYFRTYGTKVTVSRCSNNFGPWQHPEKLLPKTISNIIEDKKIPVYGNGLQRRFWIYVDEHCEAIWKILNFGKLGEVYNIAPAKENLVTNLSIIKDILHIMKKPESLIEYVKDRPGHDVCYYLIGEKIKHDCFFNSDVGDTSDKLLKFQNDLKKTIQWYIENKD